jgi:hypothetical protein
MVAFVEADRDRRILPPQLEPIVDVADASGTVGKLAFQALQLLEVGLGRRREADLAVERVRQHGPE